MLLSFIKYVSTNFPLLYPDDLTIDRCTKNGNSLFDIENRFKLGFNHLYGLLHDPTPLVVKNTLHGF